MEYSLFIEKVKKQDDRNVFGYPEKDSEHMLPKNLKSFYEYTNPIDVEVVLEDLCSIKLYPLEDLGNLQIEYDLNSDNFVFATLEGDPIFIKEKKIYIAPHGIGEWIPQLLSESFDEFLAYILDKMKK